MTKLVCLGDPTSHGGKVITASSTFTLDGRKVTLIRDLVSCPEHGDNTIIESGEGYSENGRKWVAHGCRTQCGSIVIAQATGLTVA
jgi:uncharacterized Zn-binding protein involved in type VI secretion